MHYLIKQPQMYKVLFRPYKQVHQKTLTFWPQIWPLSQHHGSPFWWSRLEPPHVWGSRETCQIQFLKVFRDNSEYDSFETFWTWRRTFSQFSKGSTVGKKGVGELSSPYKSALGSIAMETEGTHGCHTSLAHQFNPRKESSAARSAKLW